MGATSSSAPAIGRGRPRDPGADRAIVEAALAVLADGGIGNFSLEAVAARAGVAKATIYRRFDGRDALVAAALERLRDDMPVPQGGGSAYERLVAILEAIRLQDPQSLAGRIMTQVLSVAGRHPEFVAMFHDRVMVPRRRVLLQILDEGIGEGWVDPACDLEAAVTMLVGPAVLLRLWAGCSAHEPTTSELVDLALRGLRPSPPPSPFASRHRP